MNAAKVVDDRIQALFMAFCCTVFRYTRKTNFFLAKIALIVSATGLAMISMNYFFPVLGHITTGMEACIASFTMLFLPRFLHFCELGEKYVFSRNPVKILPDDAFSLFLRIGCFMFAFGVNSSAGIIWALSLSEITAFRIILCCISATLLCFVYLVSIYLPPSLENEARTVNPIFATNPSR